MKLKQTSRSNKLLGKRPNPQPQRNRKAPYPLQSLKCAIILSVKCKQKGHEAVQTLPLWGPHCRNTSVYLVDITPFHTHTKNMLE